MKKLTIAAKLVEIMLIIKVAAIVNFFILLPFGFLPLSLCEYYYISFTYIKTNVIILTQTQRQKSKR
ncbi:hypothetical protein IBE76_09880 [Francisella tularensis]|nr:hypothetical protein [Francisella tularensis]